MALKHKQKLDNGLEQTEKFSKQPEIKVFLTKIIIKQWSEEESFTMFENHDYIH